MAQFMRKAMVYLGLVDMDESEDYDDELPEDNGSQRAARATSYQPAYQEPPQQSAPEYTSATVRTLPRDEAREVPATFGAAGPRPSVVRPFTPRATKDVTVVAPIRFSDAQEIGDLVKSGTPVIVNLQASERDLARRMIDFCSGVTYALGGSMKKAADQVFLLTPSNVEVSAEERQRLSERGLFEV
jgi:cell division inhibitor SepF